MRKEFYMAESGEGPKMNEPIPAPVKSEKENGAEKTGLFKRGGRAAGRIMAPIREKFALRMDKEALSDVREKLASMTGKVKDIDAKVGEKFDSVAEGMKAKGQAVGERLAERWDNRIAEEKAGKRVVAPVKYFAQMPKIEQTIHEEEDRLGRKLSLEERRQIDREVGGGSFIKQKHIDKEIREMWDKNPEAEDSFKKIAEGLSKRKDDGTVDFSEEDAQKVEAEISDLHEQAERSPELKDFINRRLGELGAPSLGVLAGKEEVPEIPNEAPLDDDVAAYERSGILPAPLTDVLDTMARGDEEGARKGLKEINWKNWKHNKVLYGIACTLMITFALGVGAQYVMAKAVSGGAKK